MLDEDLTLDALRRTAREVDPLNDPRWEALARGELSEAAQGELRAFAEAAGIPEAFEVFRPIDGADDGALVESLLAEENRPAVAPLAAVPLPAPVPANDGGTTKSAAPEEARWFGVPTRWLAFAATAAALFVVLRVLDPFGAGPVPTYAITLSGGTATSRSADTSGELPKLLPSATIELVLRPKTPAEGPVAAKAFLFVEGHATPWSAPIEEATGGSKRIAGKVEALFGKTARGRLDVVLAVGAPDALADESALREAVEGARSLDGVQLLRQPLVLAEPPPERP